MSLAEFASDHPNSTAVEYNPSRRQASNVFFAYCKALVALKKLETLLPPGAPAPPMPAQAPGQIPLALVPAPVAQSRAQGPDVAAGALPPHVAPPAEKAGLA